MRYLLLSWFVFVGLVSNAQAPLRYRTDIPVERNGTQLPNAWAGGFNSPQFSTIDLNRDGANDLFVFDRSTDRFQTFLQVDNGSGPQWKYAPEYEAGFPRDMNQWTLLVDYDLDGRKDIFTQHPSGVRVYRNVTQPGGALAFIMAKNYLTYLPVGINIQMLGTDISAFTDVDGDQDIDILTFEWSLGSQINFYKNRSMEDYGHADSLKYELANSLWGNVRECSGCNNFSFNNSSCRVAGSGSPDGVQHVGGSSILATDVSGDGVADLILGDELCDNLLFMQNQGSGAQASFNSLVTSYPATHPADFYLFPAAFREDVNFDGRTDLLVAPNQYNSVNDSVDFTRSAWLYTDSNLAGAPKFDFQQEDFLQDGMIELGQSVVPAFADLDADGDQDMIVARDGEMTATGFRGSLYRFENTGTPSAPSFTLAHTDYLGLAALQLRDLRVSFADVNGDLAPDLVLSSYHAGSAQAFMRYLPNQAAPGQPYVFGSTFSSINVTQGRGHAPFFYDLDGDQDLDLLVGTYSGRVIQYENIGSAVNPVYVLVTSTFAGIQNDAIKRHSFPIITDLDADGMPDMVVADDSGMVRLYTDILNQTGGTLTPRTNLVYSQAQNSLMATRTGKANIGVFSGNSLAAADLDADGKVELVMGSYGGGLQMLSRTGSSTTATHSDLTEQAQLSIYPNPVSNGALQISSLVPVQVTLCDVVGREVLEQKQTPAAAVQSIDVSHLPSGVYLLRALDLRGGVATRKVIISR